MLIEEQQFNTKWGSFWKEIQIFQVGRCCSFTLWWWLWGPAVVEEEVTLTLTQVAVPPKAYLGIKTVRPQLGKLLTNNGWGWAGSKMWQDSFSLVQATPSLVNDFWTWRTLKGHSRGRTWDFRFFNVYLFQSSMRKKNTLMLHGWSWEGICPEDYPIFSLNTLVADPISLLPLKQKNWVACFNKSHVSSNHCEKICLPRWNSTFVGTCAVAAFLRTYFLGTLNVKACEINKSQLTVASGEKGTGMQGKSLGSMPLMAAGASWGLALTYSENLPGPPRW